MDIVTHTLSGLTAAALVASFSKKSLTSKGLILSCGAVGGVLPDIDAISLWSGFGTTIGSVFQLPTNTQAIYFGNYWYSHHRFFHSIASGLLLAFILFLLLSGCSFLWKQWQGRGSETAVSCDKTSNFRFCSLAFFLGYLAHLLGDLPTPGHVWGGIQLLWPLPFSIGGTGQIWWWNNYDIFLLIASCSLFVVGAIVLSHFWPKQPLVKWSAPIAVFITVVLAFYQVNHRPASFSYSGYNRNFGRHEKQSVDIQKDLLGGKMYGIMHRFDRALPLHF